VTGRDDAVFGEDDGAALVGVAAAAVVACRNVGLGPERGGGSHEEKSGEKGAAGELFGHGGVFRAEFIVQSAPQPND
jgi:hypothetical protein